MRNVVLLDIDGVLITTPPWKTDKIHNDGYSDFNENSVANFNMLLSLIEIEIWLTSSRRMSKTLAEFNKIFKNRKISQQICGFIPSGTGGLNRLIEINAFLDHEPIKNFLILDDDNSLQDLTEKRKSFWVQTLPLLGFDKERFFQAKDIIKNWY